MSRVNYYYDPPESLNLIEGPGEYCDICCKLDVVKAGTLIPVDLEDGDKEIEVAHPSCLEHFAEIQEDLAYDLQQILNTWLGKTPA